MEVNIHRGMYVKFDLNFVSIIIFVYCVYKVSLWILPMFVTSVGIGKTSICKKSAFEFTESDEYLSVSQHTRLHVSIFFFRIYITRNQTGGLEKPTWKINNQNWSFRQSCYDSVLRNVERETFSNNIVKDIIRPVSPFIPRPRRCKNMCRLNEKIQLPRRCSPCET